MRIRHFFLKKKKYFSAFSKEATLKIYLQTFFCHCYFFPHITTPWKDSKTAGSQGQQSKAKLSSALTAIFYHNHGVLSQTMAKLKSLRQARSKNRHGRNSRNILYYCRLKLCFSFLFWQLYEISEKYNIQRTKKVQGERERKVGKMQS